MNYDTFVARKLSTVPTTGIAGGFELPASLFDHQRVLTNWALRRGRGRRAIAVELKESYYRQMVANVAAAKSKTADLFAEAEAA